MVSSIKIVPIKTPFLDSKPAPGRGTVLGSGTRGQQTESVQPVSLPHTSSSLPGRTGAYIDPEGRYASVAYAFQRNEATAASTAPPQLITGSTASKTGTSRSRLRRHQALRSSAVHS